MADQLSAQALPTYGNRTTLAPNLTSLGNSGVVFERALCASPLCVPSRASLITGLLPSRIGAFDNAGEVPAGVPTLAHRLRVRGYRTVLTGKMHFIGPDQLHGFEERPMTDVYPAGFDWIPDWELEDGERLPWYHDLSSVLRAGPVSATLQLAYDEEVLARACQAIAEASADPRPLLLVVSFTHPHDPYEVPHEHWDRYDGVAIAPPAFPEPPDPRDPPTQRLRAMVGADTTEVTAEQAERARRGYYGAVSLVDDHVGALLRALDESGLAEQTMTVFTSDHGDMLGERGLWYKMAPFEDSIRVPLIVHAPGSYAAIRVAEPVSLLDLAPTLVHLADPGQPAPALDGVSLASALEHGHAPHRDVPLEYLAEGVRAPQVTLVRGSLKLIRSLGEPDLVYDVAADPGERVPLDAGAEIESLAAAAATRWNLEALDATVRASQSDRRLVAQALATGRVTRWDHPAGSRRYIGTGDDFWTTLERDRRE
jgi:choline-sulfatase